MSDESERNAVIERLVSAELSLENARLRNVCTDAKERFDQQVEYYKLYAEWSEARTAYNNMIRFNEPK